MFSKTWTSQSTGDYSQKIERLKAELQSADAILIGAGSGLSSSAGLTYGGERFLKYFSDFHEKYGITDMYSGGFYPFPSLEECWAWWSRHIYYNRYDVTPGKPYADLLNLVRGRNYFVLTTNVDHQFQLAGFDKARLFYTQGDYGLWQCSEPCHQATYDNEAAVRRMIAEQADMRVPSELIPRCPKCGKPMTMQTKLRLFFDWGITFGEPYTTPEHAVRKVAYASREELFQSVRKAQREQNTQAAQAKQSEKTDTRKSPQSAMELYDNGGEQ